MEGAFLCGAWKSGKAFARREAARAGREWQKKEDGLDGGRQLQIAVARVWSVLEMRRRGFGSRDDGCCGVRARQREQAPKESARAATRWQLSTGPQSWPRLISLRCRIAQHIHDAPENGLMPWLSRG